MKNESDTHIQLKLKARKFLQNMGCQDIQDEYRLPKIQYTFGKRPRHWKTKQSLVLDVAGLKDNRLIAVECGGIFPQKLKSLSIQEVTLYIWPYGKNKPYLWQRNINVCHLCGQKR